MLGAGIDDLSRQSHEEPQEKSRRKHVPFVSFGSNGLGCFALILKKGAPDLTVHRDTAVLDAQFGCYFKIFDETMRYLLSRKFRALTCKITTSITGTVHPWKES